MGKKRKGSPEVLEVPIDLASRIGGPAATPAVAAPEAVRRVDGPIESDRAARGRPLLIGANEPPPAPIAVRTVEPPAVSASRPTMIGLEEAIALTTSVLPEPAPEPHPAAGPAGASTREAPAQGEMDLVVTPLATPDDWHHFELALRRLPGVGTLRTEYYRAGILKLRLRWTGAERLSQAVSGVPGYRIGILGEDRSTVQIRVVRSA